MFFSQTFEPHSPLSPQFFPRPITEAYESQLDQLERLEENRKQRLRSIATVAARTPIGLQLHEASNGSAPNAANCNSYAQHRYYPPPSHEAVASFVPDATAAGANAVTTNTTRRRYMRATRSRLRGSSAASDSLAAVPSSQPPPAAGEEANNLSHLSHSHISHDQSSIRGSSFHLSPFSSPPLDPRGGGGRRSNMSMISQWTTAQYRQSYSETPRETVTPRNFFGVATTTTTMAEEDMVTPEDRGVNATPGHGAGEDVYSQRSRRRRMVDMDS